MILKLKVPGDNGRFRYIEAKEIETTHRRVQEGVIDEHFSMPEQKPYQRVFLDPNCPPYYSIIYVNPDTEDYILVYCNTQAYLCDNQFQTGEVIIRQTRRKEPQWGVDKEKDE